MRTERGALILVALCMMTMEAGAADALAPTEGPVAAVGASRVAVADPWSTRATVTAAAGVSTVNTSIPVAALENDYAGEARMAGLAIDLHGRRLGFHLALAGSATEQVDAPIESAEGSRLTHVEGALGLGATVVNARGIYLSAGPALEARATAVGHFEQGDEAVASWETVVAGGDVRARIFAGPRVYFTGSAFAGVAPLYGGWQSVDAATAATSADPVGSARLTESTVFAGHLAAAVRPAEWVAFSAGVGVRHAAYTFTDDAGTESRGEERGVRPYLALELLY